VKKEDDDTDTFVAYLFPHAMEYMVRSATPVVPNQEPMGKMQQTDLYEWFTTPAGIDSGTYHTHLQRVSFCRCDRACRLEAVVVDQNINNLSSQKTFFICGRPGYLYVQQGFH